MQKKKKHIQKKLLAKYSKYGFNESGELHKLDAQLIDYLKEDLSKTNEEKQKRIEELEKERTDSKEPISFSNEFIIKNFNLGT